MTITIIYDNITHQSGLEPDWGFSCLVEIRERTILFDTGANGSILLNNMKKLGIDPNQVDDVFISHAHFDHIGGLSAFLNENRNVTVYVTPSFRGVRNAEKVVTVEGPKELFENIYSTGELDHIEQSLLVETEKGLVVIAGCSHPEMEDILQTASRFGKVYAIIGGLHGFSKYELFKGFGWICPTHCTQHIKELRSLFPEKYLEGGAGKIITNDTPGLS